jgi:hypothetical protein
MLDEPHPVIAGRMRVVSIFFLAELGKLLSHSMDMHIVTVSGVVMAMLRRHSGVIVLLAGQVQRHIEELEQDAGAGNGGGERLAGTTLPRSFL